MAGNVREVNDASFETEVINSDKPVMVDFWATWCGPCKMIAPHVQAVADEFAGRAVVAKLDVDANKQWAIKYGIQSIPTLLFFKGGKLVDRMVGGNLDRKTLQDKINALL
jgi:thioredoxin 1